MVREFIILFLVIILIYSNYNLLKSQYYVILSRFRKNTSPKFSTNIENINVMKKQIDEIVSTNITQTFNGSKIKDMLLYATDDGKRIRPTLVLSIYNKTNNLNTLDNIPNYVLNASLCIEYIHCASLILDDIMDNDILRRNQPSMYIKYGLSNAQLCAGILCLHGVKLFNNCLDELNTTHTDFNKNIPIILGSLISELLNDLCMGQYLDISIDSTNIDADNINCEDLIHKKTSSLFEYCFVISWILSNYNKSDDEIKLNITTMRDCGKQLGLMFQIADDFEDIDKDLQRNGKNMLMNYVIVNGKYDAQKKFGDLMTGFKEKYNSIINPHLAELLLLLQEKVNIFSGEKDQ